MAMYYCHDCGDYKDDDYDPGIECGDCELMCGSCAQAYECEWCGEFDESLEAYSMHPQCKLQQQADVLADQMKDERACHEH